MSEVKIRKTRKKSSPNKIARQKISIVFEDTDDESVGFNIYMSGHKRFFVELAEDEQSPAEFWSGKMMGFIVTFLREAGVIAQTSHNPNNPEQTH